VLHDASGAERPPWHARRRLLVALSDALLWLHESAAVRSLVPDFYL